MTNEKSEYIYLKEDIDKAFDMGVDAAVAVFERTIGMDCDKQRYILQHMKSLRMESKAGAAPNKP